MRMIILILYTSGQLRLSESSSRHSGSHETTKVGRYDNITQHEQRSSTYS